MKFDVTFTLAHPPAAFATIEADSMDDAQKIAGAMTAADPRVTLTPSDGDLSVDDIEQQSHWPRCARLFHDMAECTCGKDDVVFHKTEVQS